MSQIASCSMAETIFEAGGLMNIPTPLITDILARLPPEAVIRCGSVCKALLNLISQPEFVNLHLSKLPTSLIVHKLSRRWSPHPDSFNLVDVEDETDNHRVRPIAGTDREIPKDDKNNYISMIGSIDGLVCVNEYGYKYDLIHIWNPTIREFITVQPPAGVLDFPNVLTCGFGISSGKYVVVRIFQEIEFTDYTTYTERIRDSTCHIYTVGDDGVWKGIGPVPPYLYQSDVDGLFFNGNFHWIIHDKTNSEQISCLDLANELFHPFPVPPAVLWQQHCATLNVYKGCLSVCDHSSDSDIVIWVMKKYGVQESWSKEVIISKQHITVVVGYGGARIIKVFKNGEILLLWMNDKVFLYHPERKTVQFIDVKESMIGPCDEHNPCIETREYVSSIVSLKSLGEVNINRS